MTEEDKVPQRLTQAYRELGAEEPPRALDEAILAAARKPTRPWTQRWAVPLSLAAVLVLSVTVTLRMQHEQPGVEAPTQMAKQTAPASPAPPAAEAERKLKVEDPLKQGAVAPARERSARTSAARNEVREEPNPFADQRRDQVAATPAAPPAPAAEPVLSSRADSLRSAESSVTGGAARQMEERTARDAESVSRAPQAGPAPAPALAKRAELGAAAKPAAESPERELERIAQLRRDGRHEEADQALAEFRKRYPEFRIPEAMRERVERR